MREEEDGARRIYRSSLASMLNEVFLATIVLITAVVLVSSITNNNDWLPAFSSVLAVGIPLGILVVASRYTVVTVSADEVKVKYIGRQVLLPRDTHAFSPLIEINTYKCLRFWTTRILQATDDSVGITSLTLYNFTAREFVLLLADIRRPAGTAREEPKKEHLQIEFVTPKEAILQAHRKMMRTTLLIFLGIGVVLVLITGSLLGAAIGCGLVYFCIRLIIGSEYRKVRRRMPSRIVIDNERVSFDEDVYQLAEGLQIVATPPSYLKSDHLTNRTVHVTGTWDEKGKYHFSQCPGPSNAQYVYHGYEEMCDALEQASHRHKFVMLYDL